MILSDTLIFTRITFTALHTASDDVTN